MSHAIRQRQRGWTPEDSFANRLRLLRHDLGLSVQGLSDLTGGRISHASLSNWERGARPHRLIEAIDAIVEATSVDRDWLTWGDNKPSTSRPEETLTSRIVRTHLSRDQQLEFVRSLDDPDLATT